MTFFFLSSSLILSYISAFDKKTFKMKLLFYFLVISSVILISAGQSSRDFLDKKDGKNKNLARESVEREETVRDSPVKKYSKNSKKQEESDETTEINKPSKDDRKSNDDESNEPERTNSKSSDKDAKKKKNSFIDDESDEKEERKSTTDKNKRKTTRKPRREDDDSDERNNDETASSHLTRWIFGMLYFHFNAKNNLYFNNNLEK